MPIAIALPGKIVEKTIALPAGLRNFFRLIFGSNSSQFYG
jgi:hypothetical protein